MREGSKHHDRSRASIFRQRAIGLCLLSIRLGQVHSQFTSCRKHFLHRPSSLNAREGFDGFISTLTGKRRRMETYPSPLDTSSRLYQVYQELQETRDNAGLMSHCSKTFEVLAMELNVTQDNQRQCVDKFLQWQTQNALIGRTDYATLVQETTALGSQIAPPLQFDNLPQPLRSVFFEYQDDNLGVIMGLSDSLTEYLCQQVLVESTLATLDNQPTSDQFAPSPSPSLRMMPPKFPAQGASSRKSHSISENDRRLQTTLEFARCQSQILTSNRIDRNDILDQQEYLYLLNTRVGTGFNSSVTFDDIHPIYRNTWITLAGANDGPIVKGSVPGTQTLDTIPVLYGICTAVDAAYDQVEGGVTPAPATESPTPAPVVPTMSPAPTSEPLDILFLNRCNVAVRFSQGSEPGLTEQEYVKALGILLSNATFNIDYPFDNLSDCYINAFESYGTGGAAIPVLGTINNARDDPTIVEFCTRVYNADPTRCDDGPAPTSSPVAPTPQTTPPTVAPTIEPARFGLCMLELTGADNNPKDNRLSQLEYPEYVSEFFFGLVPKVPFLELSQGFQNVFFSNISPDGTVNISFAGDLSSAPDEQRVFLRRFCGATLDAVNDDSGQEPTPSPTLPPTTAPIGGGGQPSLCFQRLAQADTATPGVLSKSEYMQFVAAYGVTAGTFEALPYIVNDNYDWIRGLGEEVDISAATAPQSATANAIATLNDACSRTIEIVGSVEAGNSNVPLQSHCYAAFTAADADADDRVTQTEFVAFVNSFLGIQYRTVFGTLHPEFQDYFSTNNENGNLEVNGSKPNQTPNTPTRVYLDFLCQDMEDRVTIVREESALLDKCRGAFKTANANADNAITESEYVALIYAMAGQTPTGVTFSDLSAEAQTYYTAFVGTLQVVDLNGFVNGGLLGSLQRTAVVGACNQTLVYSETIQPPAITNTTTVYSSFIIATNQSVTLEDSLETNSNRQDMESAYDALVDSEVGKLAGVTSRRLRRRLVVVGVTDNSPNLYQINTTRCPDSVDIDGATCEVVYGSFELQYRNEPTEDAIRTQVETAIQQAITDGELQTELDRVNDDSNFTIVGPGATLQPSNETDSGPGPTTKSGDDDDGFPVLPVMIAAAGGIGLCCCIAAIALCTRGVGGFNLGSLRGPRRQKNNDEASNMGGSTFGADKTNNSFGVQSSGDDQSKTGLGTFQTAEDDDYQFRDEPDEEQPEQSPFVSKYHKPQDEYKDEYTEDEDMDGEEYPVQEDTDEEEEEEEFEDPEEDYEDPEEELSEEEESDEDADDPSFFGGAEDPEEPEEVDDDDDDDQGNGIFGSTSAWGMGNQSPFGADNSPNAGSFFQDQPQTQPAEEASYYSSNQSKASATKISISSGSGSRGSGSHIEGPPDNAFENNFYDNAESTDGDDSSFDSQVAGEKTKASVEAQEMYGYEYEDSEEEESEEEESEEESEEEEEEESEEEEEDEDEYESEESSEEESEESATESSAMTSDQKKEYRATIEALVLEVVPDEIEHVDAMMEQFVGREEELINTLRNMTTGLEEESSEEESSEEVSSEEESSDEGDTEEDGGAYEEEVVEEEFSSDSDYEEETVKSGGSSSSSDSS